MHIVQVYAPGGPDALQLVQVPEPVPGPGTVRVRAHAIGVGRPDVLIRKGTYKWMPPLPATPGAELAGVVDALGPDVRDWQIGDRVLVSARELPQRGGCYAQCMVVPQDAPFRLPDAIAFDDAVSLPNLQLALALMRVAPLPKRQPAFALITGASGGVAGMLCQVAQRAGYTVIGTSRTPDKGEHAKAHGFDHVLCTAQTPLREGVAALTQGQGLGLVFDHLGGQTLTDGLHALAPLGTLVSYNIVQGMPSEDVFATLRQLLGKSLSVRCFSMHTFDEDRATRRGLMEEAIALAAQGLIRFPTIHRFALADVRQTHVLLDQGQVSGKLVMSP